MQACNKTSIQHETQASAELSKSTKGVQYNAGFFRKLKYEVLFKSYN